MSYAFAALAGAALMAFVLGLPDDKNGGFRIFACVLVFVTSVAGIVCVANNF